MYLVIIGVLLTVLAVLLLVQYSDKIDDILERLEK